MKKVCIVTLYGEFNYGNKLQNYALQVYLEKCGCLVETMKYISHTAWKEKYKNAVKKVMGHVRLPGKVAKRQWLDYKRTERFKNFSNQYIKQGYISRNYVVPEKIAQAYDYFVVGSDQVWRNWSNTKEELDYFLLRFCSPEKRIAASPSFGVETIDKQWEPVYRDGLNGFSNLSVREERGAELIFSLTGKTAEVLLDPTMLLDQSEWAKIERKPTYVIKENQYILLYSLGEIDQTLIPYITELQEKENLTIINLLDKNSEYYLTAPDEFLYLIHHARLAITDSFHCCVFSILYNTNFLVYERATKANSTMISRIDTLLKFFHMEDRRWNGAVDKMFCADFLSVNQALDEGRKHAQQYFSNAIYAN